MNCGIVACSIQSNKRTSARKTFFARALQKRMQTKTWKYLLGIGTALGLPLLASANLVLDGGFETPVVDSPNGFVGVDSHGTIGAWTVTAGNVDLVGNYWTAAEGKQSVDLSGDLNGTIMQSIAVTPGTYLLTFNLSGNPDGGADTKLLQVYFGDMTQMFSYGTGANSRGSMNWASESWSFDVLTGGPTALIFREANDSDTPYGAVLDNVSLTAFSPAAVPEPTTLVTGAMLLLPLCGGLRTLRRPRLD